MSQSGVPFPETLTKESDVSLPLAKPFLASPAYPKSVTAGSFQDTSRLLALCLALCGLSLGVFSLYAQASLSPQINRKKPAIVASKTASKQPVSLPLGITPVWLPASNSQDPDADLAEAGADEHLLSPPTYTAPLNTNHPDENQEAPETLAMLGTQVSPAQAAQSLQSLKLKSTNRSTTLSTTEEDEEGAFWQQVLTPGQHPPSARQGLKTRPTFAQKGWIPETGG